MKLLHVDSSIRGAESVSRILSAEIVAAERRRHPAIDVTYHDLVADPIAHLTGEHLAAAQGAVPETDRLARDLAASQAALAAFLAADIVVIGAPMYNWGIPSQLKAWFDRITVVGQTFSYSEKGPKGLCGGKHVIIASSRGGQYGADQPGAFLDHQETYLRIALEFLGTDVTFIRAEGLALGPDRHAAALDAARAEIARLSA